MIEYLPLVLTGIGLTVSMVYYASVLRNQNKTREAQLLNSIYQDLNSKEKWDQLTETLNMEWNDFEDFINKYDRTNNPESYASWMSYLWTLGGISDLLQHGMIDRKKVYNLIGPIAIQLWNKFEPIILDYRKHWDIPEGFLTFEYLCSEMQKLREEGYQKELETRYRKNR